MLNKKAQAALEYLTTYGFALVIIAIVVAVLIFMGIIKLPAASTCLGLEKLAYSDHALDANGNFALYLSNGTGYKITSISAGALGDFNSGSICSISPAAINPAADFNIVCANTGIAQGQSYSGIITITYKMGRLGMHTEKADCTGTGSGAIIIGMLPSVPSGNLYLNSESSTATFAIYDSARKIARSSDGAVLYVVYEDLNGAASDIYFAQSADNGGSWSIPINLSNNSGISKAPAIAVGADGALHFVWEDYTYRSPPKRDIFYKSCSADCSSIENWGADLNLSRIDGINMQPSIAVDGDGNINVAWVAYADDVFYKRCPSGCGNYANWSTAANLGGGVISVNGTVIAVSSDKNLHVAWSDHNGSQYDIWYRTCGYDCANSSKWSASVNLSNNSSASIYPSVVADSGNNKHIAWQDAPAAGNNEILYRNCSSGNDCSSISNWSADFNVSDMLGSSQYPSIAADSGSNIYVVWQDSNANSNYDIFYRKRLSSGSWNAKINKTSNNLGNHYPNLRASSAPGARIEYVWTYGTAADFNVLYYGENV